MNLLELAMPINMLTIVNNFEWFVIILAVEWQFTILAPQVEKESGAEGEEEIGDSQKPLMIIL